MTGGANKMRVLVINPGSTSTKVSVYDGEEEVFTESVFHDAPELLKYRTVNGQLPFRKKVVLDLLGKRGVSLDSIDVFAGRGGCAYSQGAGCMRIDQRLNADTRDDLGGSDHPAKLGVMMAWEFSLETGKPAFTVDPTNVDELWDIARVTGIKGVYKRAQSHALNQRGVAKAYCSEVLGKPYEEANLIVCHIDGGITIAAHLKGRMVDGTEGAGGDGPFTPTRLGSIPIMETAKYAAEYGPEALEAMCSRSGGFVSHFGTSDADKVHALVGKGDGHAKLVWESMCYQIAKCVGSMAVTLDGKVDAILLTGGLTRFSDLVEYITAKCSWIAPVVVRRREVEQETLAREAIAAAEGRLEARVYTGRPVFKGFPWDKD